MASGEPWQMTRALADDVSAVADPERFPNVVVGHEHSDPPLAQLADDPVNLGDGDRVDTGEGFVEQHEAGPRGKRPGDLDAAPFAPGKVLAACVAQVLETERLHELHGPMSALTRVEVAAQLEDGKEVLLHGELSKDGRFLGKIAKPEAGPYVHRAGGQIDLVEMNGSAVGRDEADEHVEARGLPCPVGAEETHHLAASHREAHVLDDRAGAVALRQPPGGEYAHSSAPFTVMVTRRPSASVSAPVPRMSPVTES